MALRWWIGGIVLSGIAAVMAVVWWLGLVSIAHYTGYFAPVWDDRAEGVYYLQRDTYGVSWGMGWEHFSPPAYAYVISDSFSLRHLKPGERGPQVLQTWRGSPVQGHVTRNYRGRIFNILSARIAPDTDGAELTMKLSIRRVPRSETWVLKGRWQPSRPMQAKWAQSVTGYTSTVDEVLQNGVEVMIVRGAESFPAAIISVIATGEHQALVRNDRFAGLYPDGVPQKWIAEHSSRARIERSRELNRVKSGLVARHERAGMNNSAATLKAYEDMEELGYFPKRPRLVATKVATAPDGLRVFEIPPDYFTVGLFRDIAEAIAEPGALIDTGTGTYLKYYDDDLGPRLKAWRNDGNDRFAVKTGGTIYVLEVKRFDRASE